MIEPTLALQSAIRAALVAAPDVVALVSADNIGRGSTRPDKMPCIITANATTTLHGHDYTAQRAVWVYLDLHIWTFDDADKEAAADAAKAIAFAVSNALDKPLSIDGCECDHFRITGASFPRDPDPAYGHGVLSVEAFVRWIV